MILIKKWGEKCVKRAIERASDVDDEVAVMVSGVVIIT